MATGMTSVALRRNTGCALSTAGGVSCWQLFDPDFVNPLTGISLPAPAVPPALATDQVLLTAGVSHFCSLSSAGAVICFGGETAPAWLGSGQIAVAAGNGFTCALSLAGKVQCWGSAAFSYSATEQRATSAIFVPTDLPPDIVAITAGNAHACALSSTRRAYCWGSPDGGRTAVPSFLQGNIKLPCVPRAFWRQTAARYRRPSGPAPAPACAPDAVRAFPGYDLEGAQLAALSLASEAACRDACCALRGCDGYAFSARLLPALPAAPCFLLANVTQLVPSNLMSSGLRSAAPS